MLVYPSGIDLSSRTLQHLSGLLAGHPRGKVVREEGRRPVPPLDPYGLSSLA